MTKQRPTSADGRAGLVMFARGDRVFPVDDLGGGVWSRRGTVLSVHPLVHQETPAAAAGVRVDATPTAGLSSARATVLWDDGSAEVLAEDKLCLVYDQEAPIGVRVVTMPMSQPCDIVDHGGQVVLVLREGLLPPEALLALREALGRVRAALTPGHSDGASVAELRRRDLSLLNALIAELTGSGQVAPVAAPQPNRPRVEAAVDPGAHMPVPGSMASGPVLGPGAPVAGAVRSGYPAAPAPRGTGIAVSRPDAVPARYPAPGADVVVGGDVPGTVERADVRVGRPEVVRGVQDVEYGPGRTPGP